MTKTTWEGEGLFGLHFHSTIHHQRSRGSLGQAKDSNMAGNWRQELMQRPWMGAAYWLATYGLLSLLYYRTKDHHPRDGTTHSGLSPPSPINH